MKIMVGVMGSGIKNKTECATAFTIGKVIAEAGATLLSGGMGGTMEAACKGAKSAGGFVVAICPDYDAMGLNKYVDICITTGMGPGRNFINVLSSQIVVALTGATPGTLSEIAHAVQMGRPLIVIGTEPSLHTYLQQFRSTVGHEIVLVQDAAEATPILQEFIQRELESLGFIKATT